MSTIDQSEDKHSTLGTSAFRAFAEVTFVFVVFMLWIKYLETTWVGPAQLYLVGWDFFAHLMMVVFPLVVIFISRRPVSDLGMTGENWRDPETRRITRVIVAELALIWAVAFLLPHLLMGERPHLLLPPQYFAESLDLPIRTQKYIGWGLTVIFTTVFCGLGEEIFFRGYMQGRINRAIGRPFKFMGVKFGWGLIFASFIFGLGHGIAFFNPFAADPFAFHPNWWEAAVTFFEGFILGLLYERTGGIIVPAALHAFIGLFFGAVVFPG